MVPFYFQNSYWNIGNRNTLIKKGISQNLNVHYIENIHETSLYTFICIYFYFSEISLQNEFS